MNKDKKDPHGDLPAWLRLYLATRAGQPSQPSTSAPVGRPKRAVPMKQTSLWLPTGDRDLIGNWQEYLSELSGGSLSLGDTVAILARICADRLASIGGDEQFEDLTDFTLKMIGENGEQY